MKTTTLSTIFTLLMIIGSLSASANFSKSIHKSWGINQVQALDLQSKFTNVSLVNNRDDSVTIDIVIKIDDVPESRGEDIAQQIEFLFSLNNGTLKAKTEFSNRFTTKTDFSIDYVINIPEDRNLNIDNRLGDLTLGNLNAKGQFEVRYGNISGLNLAAPEGEEIKLILMYGNGTFNNINKLTADIGYSKLIAGDVESGKFTTQNSIVNLDKLLAGIVDSKYDHYALEQSGDLNAHSTFTTWKIDELTSSLNIDSEYGDLDLRFIKSGFKTIDVKSSYGAVKMKFSPQASYQFRTASYFGEVKLPEANISQDITENNRRSIKGVVGESSSQSSVTIDSKYGKVNLSE